MRVVSLLPSATEICYALGVEPVGVSHECDYPPAARGKPAVNEVRIDPTASSGSIDEQVAAAEQEGGVYEIDTDLLADLDPDYVLTQGICEVCAVDRVLVAEAIDELGLDAEVVTTDPHTLADVFEDVHRIGAVADRAEAAADLVARLRSRVTAVRERAAGLDERPRVAVLDWMDPVMVAGHWVPDLVATAGGRYGLADAGERSTPREWAEIRAYDPEVLLAGPCGFGLDQTREHRAELTDRPGWADLPAVRDGRVYAMDGHHYLNRPGPRLVDTLEHLAGLLHPDRFERPPGDVAGPLAPTADKNLCSGRF